MKKMIQWGYNEKEWLIVLEIKAKDKWQWAGLKKKND